MPVTGVLESLADGMTAEEVAEEFELDILLVRKVATFFEELRHLPLASRGYFSIMVFQPS